MEVMQRQAPPSSSSLNPKAPIFIPMSSYQTVEDFSDQWWDLVHSSPFFRDYWLQDCFQDPDDFDDLFLPDFDAFFDLKQEKEKEEEEKEERRKKKEIISIAALKWNKSKALEPPRIFDKPPKIVKNGVKDNPEDVWSTPNWPASVEKAFVDLLLAETKVHFDVCATGFSEEVWHHVTQGFSKETGLTYDKKELKKHLAVLKKRYHNVKPLYTHPGFGWDYRCKMVDVDYEMWKDYTKVYPEAAPYCKYGCPLYDDLCTLFTKPIATGKYAIRIGGGRINGVNVSRSRASSNKRRSFQALSSNSSKRVATQTEGACVDG